MVRLDLYNNNRAVFKLKKDLYLLDTGAEISVFTKDYAVFKELFPDAYFSGRLTPISGFGGNGLQELTKVYTLPEFNIGTLTIHNFPVAIHKMPHTAITLIIASNILKHNKFSIDLNNRVLEIDDTKSDIYCRIITAEVDDSICKGVSVFTQYEK